MEATMSQTVRDIMTTDPVICPASSTVVDAARIMRDRDVGNVLVTSGDELRGIVTDRDLVVRGVAEGGDIAGTTLDHLVSADLVTVRPDDDLEQAVNLMRERSVRRLPVVEEGRPVGVVSLGDFAIERDSQSPLADISAAKPNT